MDRISIHCLDLAITVQKLLWQDQQAGGTLFDSKVLTSTNSSATVVEEFGQNSGFHKGWGQNAKLGPHSAIWGKLGTALQASALNPCTKFPPNPTSRKVNT